MNKIFIIGAGNRAVELFVKPLEIYNEYRKNIIGIYDKNILRAKYIAQSLGSHVMIYDNYDEVLNLGLIDAFVILSSDDSHAQLICDIVNHTSAYVFCEKPCCIDLEQMKMLSSLSKEKKERVFIMFNSRYMPINFELKRLLSSGAIGIPYSVNYLWSIEINHGVEYFRRWHSDYNRSAGLLVHKSCHHFDLLNWWLNDTPNSIIAKSNRLFYQPHEKSGERCRNCDIKCEYKMDNHSFQRFNALYFQTETEDGYIRDKCIYKDVNIDDTMSVLLEYTKGTIVTYGINFYSQYPHWYLSIVGSKGELQVHYDYNKEMNYINIISDGIVDHIAISSNNKKHSGGDECIRQIIFCSNLKVLSKKNVSIGNITDGIKACQIGIIANSYIKKDIKGEN